MSQIGKLYQYYLGKIWQKNWLKIIVFTILIGVVWWFVMPWVGKKAFEKIAESGARRTNQQEEKSDKEVGFSQQARRAFGGHKALLELRKRFRRLLEDEAKWASHEETTGDKGKLWLDRLVLKMIDSANVFGISFPFTSDNAFFFSQAEGYDNMGEKNFWKLLNDISWWNLSGFFVLYWFIFAVFDKTFFLSREEGEEVTVLTMTPGVKRSDLVWGKVLAFLTFYFLINIFLFLIPFGIYYWWLATEKVMVWFSLLSLWTVIVGPLLFFGLIFSSYLFFGSLSSGSRWIFSTLMVFFPIMWGGIRIFTSASWPRTIENFFFHPLWFAVISVVCGIFFFTLYYLKYQEEDLG